MTLEKAIEIAKDSLDKNTILLTLHDLEAVRLLIEAGKRLKEERRYTTLLTGGLLPGETND